MEWPATNTADGRKFLSFFINRAIKCEIQESVMMTFDDNGRAQREWVQIFGMISKNSERLWTRQRKKWTLIVWWIRFSDYFKLFIDWKRQKAQRRVVVSHKSNWVKVLKSEVNKRNRLNIWIDHPNRLPFLMSLKIQTNLVDGQRPNAENEVQNDCTRKQFKI